MKRKLIVKHMAREDGELLSGFLSDKFPDGQVSAEELVESATPKNSPIRRLFTWDNEECGHKWRIHEAKKMLSCLVVEIEGKAEERKYIAVACDAGDEPHTFYEIDKARKDKDIWKIVIERQLSDVNHWMTRTKNSKEFSLIHTAIEQTNKKLKYGEYADESK